MDAFRAELIGLLPRLRRFALGLTLDSAKADDLVQAACERALARQQQWQPGTTLDRWMFRILRNLWIDGRRADSALVEMEDEDVKRIPDRDWDQGMEARLALAQVLRVMAHLSPDMRAVLAVVCVEGLSYREAAELLQVPIGTVMSRLARARLELHRLLAAPASASEAGEESHAQLH